MGCDIHPAIEYRTHESAPWIALMYPNKYFGKWDHEPEFTARLDVSRDYDLFAILGNVRNEVGLAPITDNRGVPDDISPEARGVLSNEHSPTWMNLAEILAHDWDRSSKHRGCVSAPVFEKWDRVKEWNPQPESWCGAVSGGGTKIISNDEMRGALKDDPALAKDDPMFPKSGLHTWIEWDHSYSADTTQMWTKILPKMLNLGREHGFTNVRLVMDFDS
jgi:hypothetical protein